MGPGNPVQVPGETAPPFDLTYCTLGFPEFRFEECHRHSSHAPAPLLAAVAHGYCRLLFLQRLGKRSDWRKSFEIEGFQKSVHENRRVLHVIPGRGCPERQYGGVAELEPALGMRYSETDTEKIGLPTVDYPPARTGEATISSIAIPMIKPVNSRLLPRAGLIR